MIWTFVVFSLYGGFDLHSKELLGRMVKAHPRTPIVCILAKKDGAHETLICGQPSMVYYMPPPGGDFTRHTYPWDGGPYCQEKHQ